MSKLQHYPSTRRMNRPRNPAPAVDLRLRMDAWRARIALALQRDLGGFGDDQPCGCPLGLVFGLQRVKRVLRIRAGAG